MSLHAKISAHRMRGLKLSKQEKVKLTISSGSLFRSNIIIEEEADRIHQVRAACRHYHIKEPLGLVVVDYLQLLSHETKYKREEIESISRSLKRLAKELRVPFLVLSQLSRSVEYRGHRVTQKAASRYFRAGETLYMPRLSDLRESGAIEQDADLVLLLYRQDYYRSNQNTFDNIAHLRIAKQRSGPTGLVRLVFLREFLFFGDLQEEEGDVTRNRSGEKASETSQEPEGELAFDEPGTDEPDETGQRSDDEAGTGEAESEKVPF
jgi:replicative DNA helicase